MPISFPLVDACFVVNYRQLWPSGKQTTHVIYCDEADAIEYARLIREDDTVLEALILERGDTGNDLTRIKP